MNGFGSNGTVWVAFPKGLHPSGVENSTLAMGGYSPAQGVSYEFFPPSRGLGGPNELGTSSNPHPVQHVPEIPKQEAQKQTEINVARDSVDQETGMLLETLPISVASQLQSHPDIKNLVEVAMDLGRYPEVYFRTHHQSLTRSKVTQKDLQWCMQLHDFGPDNRAGIEDTLHRICCLRNRFRKPVGMTFRVGRAIKGIAAVLEDIMMEKKSILLVGPPGSGKTTILRDMARILSTKVDRRVMIVDTSSEIGGYGEVPHSAVGNARRFQVPLEQEQYCAMVEAVQNHTPEVIVVDELGGQKEVAACQSIGERGVQLIATVHGNTIEDVMDNPEFMGGIGDIDSVIIGDDEAHRRARDGCNIVKTVRERKRKPTFDVLVEIRQQDCWVVHEVKTSVDALLQGHASDVMVFRWDAAGRHSCPEIMHYLPGGILERKQAMQANFSEDVHRECYHDYPDACEGNATKGHDVFSADRTSPGHSELINPIPHEIMENLMHKLTLGLGMKEGGQAEKMAERPLEINAEQSKAANSKAAKRKKKLTDAIVEVIEQRIDFTASSQKMEEFCDFLFKHMSKTITLFLDDPEIRRNQPEITNESLQNVLIHTRTWIRQCAGFRKMELTKEQVAHGADRTVQAMLCAIGQLRL